MTRLVNLIKIRRNTPRVDVDGLHLNTHNPTVFRGELCRSHSGYSLIGRQDCGSLGLSSRWSGSPSAQCLPPAHWSRIQSPKQLRDSRASLWMFLLLPSQARLLRPPLLRPAALPVQLPGPPPLRFPLALWQLPTITMPMILRGSATPATSARFSA